MAIELDSYDKGHCPFVRERVGEQPKCQICGKTLIEKARDKDCPLIQRAKEQKLAAHAEAEVRRESGGEGQDEDGGERDETEGEDRMERGGKKRGPFRGWR